MDFAQYLYVKDGKWIREITDNDGSHTAVYLAYLSYKYAVTKDQKVKEKAIEAFKAMIRLNTITEHEGFIARSILSPTGDADNPAEIGSGGLPAKWYKSSDGKWYWKGDTSSDEVISHFYAISIFYDLVAEGKEKEVARDHLTKMATYILDCDWTMYDMDGKPTRWARWNPEYLLRPYGYMDKGLNSLEALSFMQTVLSFDKNEKFRKGYQQLKDWGYPKNTIRQKTTFPPEDIAPWDDNLAFEAYSNLLKYEQNPEMRSIYLRSLGRTWEIKRVDQNPWYNFTYGVLTGNKAGFEEAAEFMRDQILDGREFSFFNSQRKDLYLEKGYTSYDGTKKIISPRERFVGMDGRDPGRLDGTGGGNRAEPPVGFLRNYWMGRYYGIIAPAEEKITLPGWRELIGEEGADKFEGVDRPK